MKRCEPVWCCLWHMPQTLLRSCACGGAVALKCFALRAVVGANAFDQYEGGDANSMIAWESWVGGGPVRR